MIKGFLITLLSLGALYCASQEPGTLPLQTTGIPDSSYYITDLVHTIRENSKVVLNWRLSDSSVTDFFSIERSCNSKDYEVVAVMKLGELSKWFEWIDESPAKGKNIYRIKCASKDNRQIYSKSLAVQIAGDISFKFYPNPVDNILIIRSENPLDVQIIDATGKMRLTHANVQGLHTINVSSLEKGVYVLRLHNRLANTIVQDRLIKN
jgi:type IX secretion system substrate protein